MKEHQASALERFFINLLHHELCPSTVVEYGLTVLADYYPGSKCYLVIRAMISRALSIGTGPWEPLTARAHSWIHSREDKRGIIAVAFQIASYGRVKDIEEKILHRHHIGLDEKLAGWWEEKIKKTAGTKDRPRWREIAQAVGLPTGFRTMPKQDKLINACRRVLYSPTDEEVSGTSEDLVASVNLAKMPTLCRTIVWPSYYGGETNHELIFGNFELFAEAIADCLLDPFSSEDRNKVQHHLNKPVVQRVIKLATDFAVHLASLPSEKRTALVSKIATFPKGDVQYKWGMRQRSWFWPVLPIIHSVTGNTKDLDDMIVSWICLATDYRTDDLKDLAVDAKLLYELTLAEESPLHQTLGMLPLERFVQVLGHMTRIYCPRILGSYSDYLREKTRAWMKRAPQAFAEVLPEPLRTGHGSLELMLDYIELVGETDYPDILAEWLTECDDSIADSPEFTRLMTDYVIPRGLPLGHLVCLANAKQLMDLGYELRPADLEDRSASKDRFKDILPTYHGIAALPISDGISAFGLPEVWDNPVWRRAMLSIEDRQQEAVNSIIETAYLYRNVREPLAYLEATLLPECEANPKLREYVCHAAYLLMESSVILAYRFLAKDNRLRDWTDAHHRFYLITHQRSILQEPDGQELFRQLFPKDEARQLFYDSFGWKDDKTYGLPKPDSMEFAFQTQTERAGLRRWLLRHVHQLTTGDWIGYVGHFGFAGNEQIQKQLEPLIDDTKYGSGVLALLNPKT